MDPLYNNKASLKQVYEEKGISHLAAFKCQLFCSPHALRVFRKKQLVGCICMYIS